MSVSFPSVGLSLWSFLYWTIHITFLVFLFFFFFFLKTVSSLSDEILWERGRVCFELSDRISLLRRNVGECKIEGIHRNTRRTDDFFYLGPPTTPLFLWCHCPTPSNREEDLVSLRSPNCSPSNPHRPSTGSPRTLSCPTPLCRLGLLVRPYLSSATVLIMKRPS